MNKPGGVDGREENGRSVFGDGSVEHISYRIPNAIFQPLCQKKDGLVVDLSGF